MLELWMQNHGTFTSPLFPIDKRCQPVGKQTLRCLNHGSSCLQHVPEQQLPKWHPVKDKKSGLLSWAPGVFIPAHSVHSLLYVHTF